MRIVRTVSYRLLCVSLIPRADKRKRKKREKRRRCIKRYAQPCSTSSLPAPIRRPQGSIGGRRKSLLSNERVSRDSFELVFPCIIAQIVICATLKRTLSMSPRVVLLRSNPTSIESNWKNRFYRESISSTERRVLEDYGHSSLIHGSTSSDRKGLQGGREGGKEGEN